MNKALKSAIRHLLKSSSLQYMPVRVRSGAAKGAKWTLFPYSSYWRGTHESEVEAAIRRYVSRGSVCWDLGTHFGIYTLGMALTTGEAGRVYGFEPDPVSFKRCERHVRMNNLSWVELFNAGVSDTENSGHLIQGSDSGSPTAHFTHIEESSANSVTRIEVNRVVLDRLRASGKIQPPAFIKADVEGHGAYALSGAIHTIRTHLPVLTMSFHNQLELAGTREMLEPLGYRPYAVDGGEMPWANCNRRNPILRVTRSSVSRASDHGSLRLLTGPKPA